MGTSVKAATIFALLIALGIGFFNYSNQTGLNAAKNVSIELKWQEKEIRVNGKQLDTVAQAYLDGDIAMLPIQEVMQSLGGTVDFDQEKGVVTIDYLAQVLNIYLNNRYIFLGDVKKTLVAAPILKDAHVYVPSQFFVAVLGFEEEKTATSLILNKQYIVFEDPAIAEFVKGALNKATDQFSKDELKTITKLELNGKGIKSIEGIQHFTNLKILSLKSNKIQNITRLRDLKNLTEVDLSDNLIQDVRPLTDCTKIQMINVAQNQIDALRGFNLLFSLKQLNVSKNRLGDTDLSLPSKLEYLDVSDNNISKARVFRDAIALKTLVLNNNPILDADNLKNHSQLKTVYLWGYTTASEIIRDASFIQSKTEAMISTLDLDKKTSYQKILSIYDAVLYNADYQRKDKNDAEAKENARPFSVLSRGGGDSSALAQFMHILLKQANIECYTHTGTLEINGNRVPHTWNVIPIGKSFYYSDIALAHILGIENYGHHYFLVSAKQFGNTHPQGVYPQYVALEDNAFKNKRFFLGWAEANGEMVESFTGGISKWEAYNKTKVLSKDRSTFIANDGKHLYYRNSEDNGKLYRMAIDGSAKMKINEDEPVYIDTDQDFIYYINTAPDNNGIVGTLCAVSKKDGNKKILSTNTNATWMWLEDDAIYHLSLEKPGQQAKLYVMDTDGEDQKPLVDEALAQVEQENVSFEAYYRPSIFGSKGLIFYSNASEGNTLYSVRTNGKNRKKLVDEEAKIIDVMDNYVYYKNSSGIFRMMIDGSEKTALKTGLY